MLSKSAIVAFSCLHDLVAHIEKELEALDPKSVDIIFTANLLKHGILKRLKKEEYTMQPIGTSRH